MARWVSWFDAADVGQQNLSRLLWQTQARASDDGNLWDELLRYYDCCGGLRRGPMQWIGLSAASKLFKAVRGRGEVFKLPL